MQERQTKFIKIYPVLGWVIGGCMVLMGIFWGMLLLIKVEYFMLDLLVYLLEALFIIAFGVGVLLINNALFINDHIIVKTTLLTRHQIGWDEVERIEVLGDGFAVTFYGSSKSVEQKRLQVSGPKYWGRYKKRIGNIFNRQIRNRQILVKQVTVQNRPALNHVPDSKSTSVSINSPDPELYVAAPPRVFVEMVPAFAQNVHQKSSAMADFAIPAPKLVEQELGEGMEEQNSPNLILGLLGGWLAAVIGAIIWALTAYITHYEYSMLSIIIGLFVGFVTRYLAGRGNLITGMISASLSLFACVFGGIMAVTAVISKSEGIVAFVYYLLTFLTHPEALLKLLGLMVDPMSLLFYGIAIFNSYRVGSIRK